MAINKNFVIKNGIQANDNLFVADSDNNKVGIKTAIPDYDFHVIGGIGATHALVTGVTTTSGLLDINGGGQANTFKVEDLTDNRIVIAGTGGELEDSGNLTFDGTTLGLTGSQTISGDIDVDGHTDLDDLIVTGVSTFSANIDANGNLDVDGQTDLDVLNVAETATFTSSTDNTLGDENTGSVQLDGGMGIAKNLTVKQNLHVGGYAEFVGVTTFKGGTINLGDANTDNVVFTADVNSHIVPNTDDTYDLGSSSQEWRDLYLNGTANIDSLVADTADIDGGTIDGATIGGATPAAGTFTNLVANGNVDLGDATSDTITATGRFDSDLVPSTDDARDLGSSTLEWKDLYLDGTANIDSLVADTADINAGTIDGATIGANSASTGAFTTISASSNVTITGNLDVDGRTDLDDLVVAGVSTFSANIDANGNLDVDGRTDLDDLVVAGVSTFSDAAIFSSTGSIQIPAGTTAQRLTGVLGQIRYNTQLSQFEGYGAGNAWGSLGGVKDVDGDTFIRAESAAGEDEDTLEFLTADATRVTINAAGRVGIGSTLPTTNLDVDGTGAISGDLTVVGVVTSTTFIGNLTGNVTGNTSGSAGSLAAGATGVDLTLSGDLTVNGTTTTINSTTVSVDDKNIELGSTSSPSDTSADGGGITLKGTSDHTFNWVNSTDAWTSSEHLDLASSKGYMLNGTTVLSGTTLGSTIVTSSLTALGTITTGVWNGTAIANAYLANSTMSVGGVTLTLGATDATPAFDLSDATNYPTTSLTGTITNAQLAGSIADSKLSTISTADKVSISALNIDGGTDIGAALADADLFIVDDGGGGTNRYAAASRIKSYIADVTLTTAAQTNITSVGTLTALAVSGDITIADTIVHDGDSNTKIRFPGADTFSVETAGSERLLIDSSGNVDIGANNGSSSNTGWYIQPDGTAYVFTDGSTDAVKIYAGSGDERITLKGDGELLISDKITHMGDTNTKIRFPAADTFTVETSGSEAIRVDSSQRLLVGTTSSRATHGSGEARLQIEGTNTATAGMSITRTDDGTGSATFSFGKTRDGSEVQSGDNLGTIYWQADDGTDLATPACYISAAVDGTPGSNDMPGRIVLATTADGESSPTERLRITSGGKIGINSTSPTADLEVAGTTGTASTVFINAPAHNSSTASEAVLKFGYAHSGSPGAVAEIKLVEGSTNSFGGHLTFSVPDNNGSGGSSTSEALRITSDGNIGIGTDNPSQKVHIQDSSGPLLTFDDATTQFGHVGSYNKLVGSGNIDTFLVSSANSKPLVLRAPSGQSISFDIASSNAMTIDSSGRLLLGTTTEGAADADNLTIADSGDCGITIRTGTTSTGSIYFSDATSGTAEADGFIDYNQSSRYLRFGTAQGERMRINSSGKILSGIATARGNLANNASGVEAQVQIEGTSFTSSTLSIIRNSANADDGGIIIGKTRSASTYGNAPVIAGDDLGSLIWAGSDGTSLQFGAEIVAEVQSGVGNDDLPTDLIFKTNAGTTDTSEKLRITSAGNMGLGCTPESTADFQIRNSSAGNLKIGGSGTDATGFSIDYSNSGTTTTTIKQHYSATNSAALIHLNTGTFTLATGTSNVERLRVNSTGNVLVGTSTSRIVEDHVGNGPQGLIQIESTDSAAIMSIISAGTADANRCGTISLGRHRGGIGDTPTIVQDNDSLGAIVFAGGDGNDMRSTAAKIHAEVDGSPGQDDMPGALVFSTTPDGSASPYNQERMRITSSGRMGLGETTPDFKFHSKETGGSSIAGLFETNQTDSFISFQASGTTASSTVRIGAKGDDFVAYVNGDYRLYVKSNGDIQRSKSLSQEVSTSVSSVSATSCGSFAKATYRSAYVVAQITQGSSYQVGRYLLIHDGTTVTTIEESAIATGSMLGTFEGVINGSNVEFRVTMGSASSATVITKIESIVV